MLIQRLRHALTVSSSEDIGTELAGHSSTLRPSTWWLILIVILCVASGLWGWSSVAPVLNLSAGDVAYRSLSALWLSDVFQSSATWGNEPAIEVSRWLGVVAFVLGATKAVMALLSDRWRRYRARRRSGHVVVIGDTELARALVAWALRAGRDVHWSEAPADVVDLSHQDLFVSAGAFGQQAVGDLSIPSARLCAVTRSDDVAAWAAARCVRSASATVPLLVSVRSPWLALHLDSPVGGIRDLRLLSESRIAVRAVQRRHPPFLLARRQTHEKLHCVIVGFGDTGEAVLAETLLSSMTFSYSRPVFTIIDPDADRVQQHLALRYPELHQSAELRFVAGSVDGTVSPLSEKALTDIAVPDPVSTVYVCLDDADEALGTAFVLTELTKRERLTAGPVHVYLSSGQALKSPPPGAKHLDPGALIPFGSTASIVDQLGLYSSDSDELAKAFHAAYRARPNVSEEADRDWENLSEDLRDSNRHQILHVPAKLESVGVDIEKWLQSNGDEMPTEWPPVGSISDEVLERLSELEHDRWMVDRRLNGWRQGDERLPEERRHDCLVPFVELSEEDKDKDRSFVAGLIDDLSR